MAITYRIRQQIVEPVFGVLKRQWHLDHVTHRGREKGRDGVKHRHADLQPAASGPDQRAGMAAKDPEKGQKRVALCPGPPGLARMEEISDLLVSNESCRQPLWTLLLRAIRGLMRGLPLAIID